MDKLVLLSVIIVMFFASCEKTEVATEIDYTNEIVESADFTDTDGQTYKTLQIGEKVWFTENYNKDIEGSLNYMESENNKEKGRLYTKDHIKNNIPDGFRLPTSADFKELEAKFDVKYFVLDSILSQDGNAKRFLNMKSNGYALDMESVDYFIFYCQNSIVTYLVDDYYTGYWSLYKGTFTESNYVSKATTYVNDFNSQFYCSVIFVKDLN